MEGVEGSGETSPAKLPGEDRKKGVRRAGYLEGKKTDGGGSGGERTFAF